MDEEVRIEDLFEVVSQPEYSLEILLSLQSKYDMLTQDFVRQYCEESPLAVPPKDAAYWLFHWEQFVATEGNENDLTSHFFDLDYGYNLDRISELSLLYDDPLLIGQVKEEAVLASSFYFVSL